MRHVLKIWPSKFELLNQGRKYYEWRKHDRDFAPNDELVLAEWSPLSEEFTGDAVMVRIDHVMTEHGVPPGWCILGLRIDEPLPRPRHLGSELFNAWVKGQP